MTEEKKYDVYPLSRDGSCFLDTDIRKTGCNNNIVAIGGTGSGKSRGVVTPILLNMEENNCICTFTKSNVMNNMAEILRGKGYTVNILNLADEDDHMSDVTCDLLTLCKNDKDVKALARSIVDGSKRERKSRSNADPFWDDSAASLIYAVLRYVWRGLYDGGRSLDVALELIKEIKYYQEPSINPFHSIKKKISFLDIMEEGPEEWDKYLEDEENRRLIKLYPLHWEFRKLKETDSVIYTTWISFLSLSQPTGSSVVITTQTAISEFYAPRPNHAARKWTPKELLKPKQALFILTSPVNLSYASYVAVLYSHMIAELFELGEKQPNGALPYQVNIICDDFATGASIPRFADYISIFREKGIAAAIMLQNLSQLHSIYDSYEADTIINNCDTLIYMGGMDLNTAKFISARVDVPVVEVANMKPGREYFIQRGKNPVRTDRFDISYFDISNQIDRRAM